MKERFSDLYRKWAYANQNKDFFKDNKLQIDRSNIEILKNINSITTVYFGALCIFGLNTVTSSIHSIVCIISFLISLFFYIECRVFIVEHKYNYSARFCYAFCGFLYCFSMYIGCFNKTVANAVMFPILLIALPLMFVFPPIHINMFSLIFIAVYLMEANNLKPSYIVAADFINLIACVSIGCITSYTMIGVRLREINSARVLENACNIDDLTGLQNRRSFNNYIIKSFEEDQNKSISMMMIDIDNFRSYNDTYGHISGDICLEKVGKILYEFCNIHSCYVARYGGEEFVIVDKIHSVDELKGIAGELLDCIFSLDIDNINSKYKKITVSIGISSRQISEVNSYIELINLADDALFQAKENGKNSIILGTHALYGFGEKASIFSM